MNGDFPVTESWAEVEYSPYFCPEALVRVVVIVPLVKETFHFGWSGGKSIDQVGTVTSMAKHCDDMQHPKRMTCLIILQSKVRNKLAIINNVLLCNNNIVNCFPATRQCWMNHIEPAHVHSHCDLN